MYKGIITTPTAATANTDIVFKTAVSTNNKTIANADGTISLVHPGIWDIDANLVVENAAAGDISAQLYANGVAIPEALATVTHTTAGKISTLSIRDALRVVRSYGYDSAKISVRLSADVTINAAVLIAEIRR